jgi:hypothetical protein
MSNLLSRETYTIDLDSISFDVTESSDSTRKDVTNEVTAYKVAIVPKVSVNFFINTNTDNVYTVPVYFDELGSMTYTKNNATGRVEAAELTPAELTDITADKVIEKIDAAIEDYIKDMENKAKWDSTKTQIKLALKNAISEIKA